jgi:4-amino-4-deoxy-L-arabinose transferase-like glycosyltransferase
MFKDKQSEQDWPWLGLVLVAGLSLRLWGIGWGLPNLYHADEGLTVRQALAFGAGYLQPYEYVHSPLLPYIVTVLYGLHFLLGLASGRFHSPSDLAVSFFNNPTPFYLLARLTSTVFGVAAILVAYALGMRAYGHRAGLVSALCVALSPALVRHAHYSQYDIPMACLVLVALTLLWRFAEEPDARRFLIASVAVGLAIVMKYAAFPLVVPFVVAVLWVAKHRHWSRRQVLSYLAWGGIVAGGTFVAVSPYTVLDFHNFWSDVVLFQLATQVGYGQAFSKILAYYASALTFEGLGLPLMIAGLAGLAYAIYRRRSADLLLASFAVSYLAVLLLQRLTQPNYIVGVVPVLGILAALALDAIWHALPARWARWWPAALLVLGVAVGPMAYRAYRVGQSFSWPDTRTMARAWIEANIPAGAKTLSDPTWTVPQLRESRASLTRSLGQRAVSKKIETRAESTQAAYGQYARYQLAALDSYSGPTYDIEYIPHLSWQADESAPDVEVFPVWGTFRGKVFSLEELRAQGFQYAVVSSLKYAQYLREDGKQKWPSYYALYSSLEEQCRLLKEFAPDTRVVGPVIKIYDLRSPACGGTLRSPP